MVATESRPGDGSLNPRRSHEMSSRDDWPPGVPYIEIHWRSILAMLCILAVFALAMWGLSEIYDNLVELEKRGLR